MLAMCGDFVLLADFLGQREGGHAHKHAQSSSVLSLSKPHTALSPKATGRPSS